MEAGGCHDLHIRVFLLERSPAVVADGGARTVQVPAYAVAQVIGSTAASLTLRLLFGSEPKHFFGTVPSGSDVQSLVLEFIITFYLMFVVSGVATDNRAVSKLEYCAFTIVVLGIDLFFYSTNC
jgi:glycerol uptake facilitator-like aquaporin